jgi:hypothetical protein
MSYITRYLRANRDRRVETPAASASNGLSASSVDHEPVFQINFETWYACLAGWNPVPLHTVGALKRFKASEKSASKAA